MKIDLKLWEFDAPMKMGAACRLMLLLLEARWSSQGSRQLLHRQSMMRDTHRCVAQGNPPAFLPLSYRASQVLHAYHDQLSAM